MKNINLFFRYVFLFSIVVVLTAILMNSYKEKRVQVELRNYSKKISKAYKTTYTQYKQISELIFFNNILYDKKVLESFSKKNSSQEDLYYYLRNRFFYLKSFGLKNISFYLPSNKLFLQMQKEETYKGTSNFDALRYINKTLDELSYLEITKNKAVLKFIKPIFDNNLNHLANIELEFSLDAFANKMEEHLFSNVLFIYKKDKNLDLKANSFFDFTGDYIIEKNRFNQFKYNKEIFEKIKSSNKDLKNLFFSNTNSTSKFYYNNRFYPFTIIPLKNEINKDIYLFAYGIDENSTLAHVNKNLDVLLIIFSLIFLIIVISLYKYSLKNMSLLALRRKHKDLLKALDKYVIMVETNKEGIITNITQPCCTISGYTKEEFLGKNVNMLRHPDISPKFFEKMWKDLKENKLWEGEIKNKDKYGNSYWVKGAIFPKYDEEQEHIGYTSIRVNITDEVQLRKFNRLLKEDLSNKLNEIKMKDQNIMDNTKVSLMAKVLDTTSHQWKKPISEISIELANLEAQSLKEKISKKELENISKKISKQLKNLSMTLNEFKSFFSDGEQSDRYNVYLAISEAISMVKNQEDYKNITISLDSKKEIYCYGFFDEIKYTIFNLLKNSFEQLSKVKNAYIELSIIKDEDDVLIKYSDNSNEESKNLVKNIFSSSYKKELDKNLGLNLYISKLLIEKSGAKMLFDENSENTTFYIKLVSKDRRELGRTYED